ncbi:BrnT family toxin [Candidatus Gottesmanbacteria bacterium]|nr:BrnT family toxin [Candidatus Gottesmanbacteria bacterium]
MDEDFVKVEKYLWDRGNLEHIKKHKITSEECEEVFNNRPLLVRKDVGHSQKEERFEVLGQADAGQKVFLVYTVREEQIRVISARNQSRKERKFYEQIEKNPQI